MNSSFDVNRKSAYGRKDFLKDSLKLAGGFTLLSLPGFSGATPVNSSQEGYTVQDIIDLILKEVPGAPFKETVDTLKSGSADQKVTGILTTMFATIDVIKEAKKRNANFIIAHEPAFYNHTDDKNWVDNNDIVQQKAALLQQYGITVWRFHDYCHALKPDAVSYGVAKKTGWLPYFKTGEVIMEIPAMKFLSLVQHLKKSLNIAQVRVIGDAAQDCKRIAILPGAWGGQRQVLTVVTEKPDVIIVGEAPEWETPEFIRDGRLLGSKTSLIVLGHSVSEEPGMEWVAEWLQPKLNGITVTHISSNSPFTWL